MTQLLKPSMADVPAESAKRVDMSGWKFSQYDRVLINDSRGQWTGVFLRQTGRGLTAEAEIYPDGDPGIRPTRRTLLSNLRLV